jgi:hypothetical protein
MSSTDPSVSGSRPQGGPDAEDPARRQLDVQRNALHQQADMQATPETEDQHRAVAERTGNARRAESAAGGSPDENNRPDANRAYQESRGDRREREENNRPG